MIPSGPAYSWRKALLLIFFSTLLSLSLFAFLQTRGDLAVAAIIQESEGEKLPTQCLAEMLNLSVDEPVSFAHFPLAEAERRLRSWPFMKQVSIKKIRPNILYIRYTMRRPVAFLGDGSSEGIDLEGVRFPLRPYYALSALPIVYGYEKGGELLPLLLQLPVRMIDLSFADAPSLGHREVVVQLEDERFLRLPVYGIEQAVAHFQKKELAGRIIDLRIPNTAYIHD